MRLFVAVELSDEVHARAGETIARLKGLAPDSKWVRADNLHLTLAFLGEVADSTVS
jgi:RNA 2',3'-cyclic 3'-phosphodiesterase